MDLNKYIKRHRSLKTSYSPYKDEHREISEMFRPRRGHFTGGAQAGSGTRNRVSSKRRGKKIINNTAVTASKNAQSGLQAGVTSPSRPWKKIGPGDTEISEIPGTKEAYAATDRLLDRILAGSNFYEATHTSYADFVDHGVGAIQIDEHEDDVIRCVVHPIGSWVGAVNADGKVDVFYRDYDVTGYELKLRFGEDALEPGLVSKIKEDPYTNYTLYNAIEPNDMYAGENVPAIGLAAFPYISVWWIKGHTQNGAVKIHGYHEFPVMAFRFYKGDLSDVYASGPGFDALGDAKQLQHQERTKLLAEDKMVSPPLQAPTELKGTGGVSLVPNKVTYHDSPNGIKSIYEVNLPINYVREDISACEERIKRTYFEDLFLMISQTVQRQTTAREIEERHQEKLLMLGPVLESISGELLDPAIDRIIGIVRRRGLLPEFPEAAIGAEFKIEYISILAQAQQAVQTIPIEQGINFTMGMAEGFPDALDRINVDGVMDAYFERTGMPPEGINSVADAKRARDGRAQAAAQQQQAEGLQQQAETAKTASEATLTQPNVLTQLLGGAAA